MTPSPRLPDFDHIYLSPHLDDAVLSCGGRIGQQTAAGQRVLVVTVCAGDPPAGSLSGFAQLLHDRWGLPSAATQARRAEDLEALAVLGADALHLALPDCIYRRAGSREGEPLYASEEALFGPLHPHDWWLSLDLSAQLAEFGRPKPEAGLYFPIGIGGHVDHQLTWRLADDWAGAHPAVFFYEDYPYAHDLALAQQWVEGRGWQPLVAHLAEADFERKLQAIRRYRSQICTFWADEAAMAAALREHAASVAGSQGLAERVWYNLAPTG